MIQQITRKALEARPSADIVAIRNSHVSKKNTATLDWTIPAHQQFEYFYVLSAPTPPDPIRPTAAILDVSSWSGNHQNLATQPAWKLIAESARADGYNVMVLQANHEHLEDYYGIFDYSKVLMELYSAIQSGKIELGEGDALLITYDNSYRDAELYQFGRLLGVNVNSENAKELFPRFVELMKWIAEDEAQPSILRKYMRMMHETNFAVDPLQSIGIDIVKASINIDFTRVDPAFLSVQTLLVPEKDRHQEMPSGEATSQKFSSAEHQSFTSTNHVDQFTQRYSSTISNYLTHHYQRLFALKLLRDEAV
jgi:hypothetical protein